MPRIPSDTICRQSVARRRRGTYDSARRYNPTHCACPATRYYNAAPA